MTSCGMYGDHEGYVVDNAQVYKLGSYKCHHTFIYYILGCSSVADSCRGRLCAQY